jgi:hypothetical protein
VDRHPVHGGHVDAVDEPVERRHEPTARAGHLDRRDVRRERHDAGVRPRDVEPLAERAPRLGGEAERDPVVAGVRVAGPTGRARPVAEAERDGDAVALADLLDLVADRDDDAGGFVPEDVPLRERPGLPERVVPPGVPVAPTDAARRGLDHAPPRVRLGSSTGLPSSGSP